MTMWSQAPRPAHLLDAVLLGRYLRHALQRLQVRRQAHLLRLGQREARLGGQGHAELAAELLPVPWTHAGAAQRLHAA